MLIALTNTAYLIAPAREPPTPSRSHARARNVTATELSKKYPTSESGPAQLLLAIRSLTDRHYPAKSRANHSDSCRQCRHEPPKRLAVVDRSVSTTK